MGVLVDEGDDFVVVLGFFVVHFLFSFIVCTSLELVQESDIVVENQTQIGNPQATHGHTLQAHTKGKAGILFGVDTTVAQNLGMHHTGA